MCDNRISYGWLSMVGLQSVLELLHNLLLVAHLQLFRHAFSRCDPKHSRCFYSPFVFLLHRQSLCWLCHAKTCKSLLPLVSKEFQESSKHDIFGSFVEYAEHSEMVDLDVLLEPYVMGFEWIAHISVW